ncbi:major paralogous domain-containing protein, partial [Fibrobacter sp. UWH9]|uniref:FISUMP domain-containing protein n=1 Tax=Fibrobacter sp. UWH9 TaxID=1896213 RepID=UPI00091ED735
GGESNPASSSVKSSNSGTSADSSAGNSSSSSESALEPCDAEEEGETKRVLATGVRYICKNGFWVEVESSSSVSSSSYFDMTEQFNPDVKYGDFTDPRDGKKYRTVELKNGVFMESYTVFAENLNYGKMISGGSVQEDSTKYCYDDDPWYCENGWGGLYTWSRAMNFPAVCDSFSVASEKCPNKFNLESDNEEFNGKYYFVQHQGICPEGWHIMNENEWVEISEKSRRDVAYYMGSKVAGFGSNNYGLSILPAGYWQLGKFDQIKLSAGFYLPQQHNSNEIAGRAVYVEKNFFERSGGASKIHALSIRCVKNY